MKPHKAQDLTINIPAAIKALPGLILRERATLAHISNNPGVSNAALASLSGVSMREAENLVRRLAPIQLLPTSPDCPPASQSRKGRLTKGQQDATRPTTISPMFNL